MKFKILLRPSLAIVFAFIGVVVVRRGAPEILAVFGNILLIAAALAFGILGFILPEVLELAGRAGIAALARQIVSYLPTPSGGLSVPTFSFRKKSRGLGKGANPLICDTSVLIDGRIVDIAASGFILGTIIVAPSVIRELHTLADLGDSLKRGRGRRGLDVLAKLQKEKKVKVEILAKEPVGATVDEKLVELAHDSRGKLLTVDWNLNKVASARKIGVLNINELANAVKTAVLPGERLMVTVSNMGREKDQGVGYLADGTMVVVEEGAGFIGQTVNVVVGKVLQTAAGKMVFARRAN